MVLGVSIKIAVDWGSAMDELTFHVIIATERRKDAGPIFVYVGTPEEAAEVASDFQRQYDREDRVTSKWKRKRVISVKSVDGRVGTEELRILAKVYAPVGIPLIGDGELIDEDNKDDDDT